jgi:SAM-dependent methyltransferase
MPVLRTIASTRAISGLKYRLQVLRRMGGVYDRECTLCGYAGKFRAYGLPPRFDAHCPVCGSLERHRLLKWYIGDHADDLLRGKRVLHFAPERCMTAIVKQAQPATYVTADLHEPNADEKLNIEAIDKPANSFDVIICSHVLEHVDDRRALEEIHRVLSDGGAAILMVPIIEAWQRTYENSRVRTTRERELHFNQRDHVRFYGRDFRTRIRESGFDRISEFTASGDSAARYSLTRGETVFVARKTNPSEEQETLSRPA